MEWILGILILIVGGAAIVVIYLSERINIFETLLGLNPKVTSDKLAEHVTFGPNPFGDLSGENLWKAMAGEEIYDDNIGCQYRVLCHFESRFVFPPFRSGVDVNLQPGKFRCQCLRSTRTGPSRMCIKRYERDAISNAMACDMGFTAHNGPLPHIRFQ